MIEIEKPQIECIETPGDRVDTLIKQRNQIRCRIVPALKREYRRVLHD